MCHTPKPEPVTPQSLLGLWRGIQVRSRVLTIIHIIRSLMACTKRHIISVLCLHAIYQINTGFLKGEWVFNFEKASVQVRYNWCRWQSACA